MNILKFIESFTDDNLMQTTGSRRQSLAQFGQIGKKSALAAIPGGLLALLLVPNKTAANITFSATQDGDPKSALKLALMLEYLDSEFYAMGLDKQGLIPAGRDRDSFTRIVQNENAHVNVLIQALGGTDSPDYFERPEFDYTAGGIFNPFDDYQEFLALSQAFEDTGVRAYKGQAPNLMSNPDLLQSALQIHATEARQAAEIRQLRGVKGWIRNNNREGLKPQSQGTYAGEELTTQAGFNTANVGLITGASGIDAGSEAFDEPLTREQVMAIANMFIPA